MKSEIVNITPSMASAILELNTSNRNVKLSHVRTLSGAMKRGEWILSPQAIQISSENVLIDGQHRLLAVVDSGVTIKAVIWNGVSPDVYKITDRGVTRTMSDVTKLPSRHTAVLSFFYYLANSVSKKPTPQQILKLNESIGTHIEDLLIYAPKGTKVFSQVGLMSAAVFMSYKGERDYAFDLYRRLVLANTEGLPSIAAAMVKQVLSGTFTSGKGGDLQVQAFAKGTIVFSEKNKDRKIMVYSDTLRNEVKAEVKEVIMKMME